MTMICETFVKLFLISCLLGFGQTLIHVGFAKIFGSAESVTNVRTTQLLNQLCNESQDNDDTIQRDACYGCFFRSSQQPSGYPMLLSMAACADLYLNNTDYGHCRAYLRNATSTVNSRASPTIIYCTFLECIRQVNKDNLIRLCVGEAIKMFSNFTLTDVYLAQLFVNTTACVLAKTRCSPMNPITGAYHQEADITNKLHLTSVNAILVNSDYDINIVQLPFGHGVHDECAKYRNIRQANWPSVKCIDASGFY